MIVSEAFVLAGGESKRFGGSKALHRIGGGTLVDILCDKLSDTFDRVRVIARTRESISDISFEILEDVRDERCPLTGIYSGLCHLGQGKAFFVACDLPLVRPALIEHIVKESQGVEAVVPRTKKGLEPLCAVYDASCLEAIRSAFSSGDLRTISFLESVKTRTIEEEELRKHDPQMISFWNVNCLEDMGFVLQTLEKEMAQGCS
jgi:molybdopterin-guanine dinucleotide biosynthesis protein A